MRDDVVISGERVFSYVLPLPITEEDAEEIGEHIKGALIDALQYDMQLTIDGREIPHEEVVKGK